MILALTIGVLVAGAVYLLMDATFFRVVLGFVLLSHAVNLVLFAAGGSDRRGEPLGADLDPTVVADALPQAFVLTAIVIAFAITVYMIVLATTGDQSDDVVESDLDESGLDPADLDAFGVDPAPQDGDRG